MHFAFSTVKENADENEIPFRPKNENESHLYPELSYGIVSNITLSAQRKCHFWNENEK